MKRLLGITTAIWLLLGATAVAQTYSQSEGTLDVDASSVAAGDTLTVSGDGFASGTEVEIVLTSDGDTILTTVTADDDGEISVEVSIPESFSGDGVLFARGASSDGGTRVLAVRVSGGALSQLAFTGSSSNTLWIVAGAIGLVAFGVGTLRIATSRRTTR